MRLQKEILYIKEGGKRFARSKKGQYVFKFIRLAFFAIIVAWLGINLYEIGWRSVWNNLPIDPVFYLIFLVMYVSAPIADIIIYNNIWGIDIYRSIPAFFKKRILNTDVVGYSGEVYFFTWARNQVELPDLKIGETVRDVNILSAIASNAKSIMFLLIFGYWARDQISLLIGSVNSMYFVMIGIVGIIFIPIIVRFRKYIFTTPFKTAKFVFGIYFARLSITMVLQIVMWMVVIPEVPVATWLTYSVVSILVSRIPTSNKKLIFVGIGVEIAASLGIPQDQIFGLLICVAALEKVLNFVLYFSFALLAKLNPAQQLMITQPDAKQQQSEVNSAVGR